MFWGGGAGVGHGVHAHVSAVSASKDNALC